MANILYVSDLASEGSGYAKISISLCVGLAERGHDIKIIGLNYRGEEHRFPLSIIPCAGFPDSYAMINNFMMMPEGEWKPDIAIIAFDLPQQHSYIERMNEYQLPYIGITPLENSPLTFSWAAPLLNADVIYFISEMGTNAAKEAGVNIAEYIQIGVDPLWIVPEKDDRDKMRKNMGVEDKFVVLSVADNQERKNLWAGLAIICLAVYGITLEELWKIILDPNKHVKELEKQIDNLKYILITREHLTFGWKLRDLATELGIEEELSIVERGIPFEQLWTYYAISDMFLNTSKAEGLGMPVLEAMSVGTPVLASETGAIPELLENGRGFTIPPEYSFIDVWGNSRRDMVNIEEGAKILREMMVSDLQDVTKKAKEYTESRNWDTPIKQLGEKIEELLNGKSEEN